MSCFILHRFKDIGNNFRINRIFAYFRDKMLQITEIIKMLPNERCIVQETFGSSPNERRTVQETFGSSRTNAALCRRLSEVPERTLHCAGDFRKFPNERCTAQETFGN
jgi:hypothetical protein